MDEFNKILLYLFVVEAFIILFFLFIIPLHRFYLSRKKERELRFEKTISQTIIQHLNTKESKPLPDLGQYSGSLTLLKAVESFDHKIKGGKWDELKKEITTQYLLPEARKKVECKSWVERNFAARTFALTPLKEDEGAIHELLNDKVFLVKSVAAIALVRLDEKKGIAEIIRKMSFEKGYTHYFYRDILIEGSDKVFATAKELAETEKDPDIHRNCLEFLTTKTLIPLPGYIRNDLKSKDPRTRLAALQILAESPQKDSESLLSQYLHDQDPEIRASALSGLHYFGTENVFHQLQEALKDPVWDVRFQAARTLKKMGEKGILILNEQHQDKDKNAYEAAHTALEANW